MPYTYLDDIAIADVAFLAVGRTREEVFSAAADATMNVMVEDLSTIRDREKLSIHLQNEALDLLLFSFLNEVVFYKDAKRLLLRVATLRLSGEEGAFDLNADLYGEEIDPMRHPLRVDVKAVTLHRFALTEVDGVWQATVVLDI
jgi:SHS2 domain-containing protein